MEDWVTIRNLKKKDPNLGTRTIALMLGISRNTVKKALLNDELPLYNRGERKINEAVEPFIDFIKESFLKKNLKASRILKDIKSKGYKGSQYALYAYIREILKPIHEDVTKTSPNAYMRYETKPAEQMQYDWSPYTVSIGGNLVKINVHQTILGFSRYKFYDVSLNVSGSDVYTALEESFIFFGGVCERIQVDNATVFITNASKDNLVWNPRFLSLCGLYGIKPTRSMPSHPWSKGKVESPFSYLETHFISGNEFTSFEDLRVRLKQFQNEHNLEVHGTTKQITKILFEKEEQNFLKPLPINPITGELKRYVWGQKYPHILQSWLNNWNELATFFKYPKSIQTLIYTTNPIESLNSSIKRKTNSKGSFPTIDSAFKMLYMSTQEVQQKWERSIVRNWSEIYPQLCIFFSEVMEKYTK